VVEGLSTLRETDIRCHGNSLSFLNAVEARVNIILTPSYTDCWEFIYRSGVIKGLSVEHFKGNGRQMSR